ncbi:nicotinate-nucleotide--dimethylbenzimidazole phosphoribosyltransferase [Desulforegula conservatrix]|uniref:nicotinate-nucleotide--dimethylbenzimidazole phosphoribosyltransferase n=1 Tax=Desulforegula conservatrix TaxID=153026 RepID=UPI000427B052|nr:nicotinate-nucleotide--dimethylbenzimidazole phosphoribosyltransferase [Desulforegula conservatrix]
MNLLNETLKKITGIDENSKNAAKQRLERLTMPYWAMGRLMDLAEELAGITGNVSPQFEKRTAVIMAADHGIADAGVSSFPKEVTAQMVYNFLRGGAGINAMANMARAKVKVVDMGVASPLEGIETHRDFISCPVAKGTMNMAKGPAMTVGQAVESIEKGIRIALELAADTDIFAIGEMGIGNTTPSSAIVSVLTGISPSEATGRGTGIDDEKLSFKISMIEKSIEINNPDPSNGIDVLSKIGGFEIGGMAGIILGAASVRKPVIIDGFISTASALIADSICPLSRLYMIPSHKSVEQGHIRALEKLGKKPLLDLGLRLGEATGAVLCMPFVEAASRLLTDVATFDEAGVNGGE